MGCSDVDECADGSAGCDEAPVGTCMNTVGSFACGCATGFIGTGASAGSCLWNDPSLVSLAPSAGALSPAFAGGTTTYTLALPAGATSATLTPTLTWPTRATRTYTVLVVRSATYVKASDTDAHDNFGYVVSLSADGSMLAVGAYQEDSSATGVGGDEANNGARSSGAAYVYTRSGAS